MSGKKGISSQMKKFASLFGVILGESSIGMAENVSGVSQRKEISEAEVGAAALELVTTI